MASLEACELLQARAFQDFGNVQVAACEAYGRLCPDDLSGAVAPGMHELLERLAGRENTVLSLVTGNFEAIARYLLGVDVIWLVIVGLALAQLALSAAAVKEVLAGR